LRVKNHTDVPDKAIREMIRFGRPNGISKFDVRISNLKNGIFRGCAYIDGSSYHKTTDPFVVVSVTEDANKFPYFVCYKPKTKTKHRLNLQSSKVEAVSYKTGTGGYLDHLLLSREEAILHGLAHELRHLWQAKVKKGYRVWGARGQFSDRDADAYAIKIVRVWRRLLQSQLALRNPKDLNGCSRFEEFFENIARSINQG
jgi:hypothetical protein